jgi:hypothetical protein
MRKDADISTGQHRTVSYTQQQEGHLEAYRIWSQRLNNAATISALAIIE